MLSLFRNYDLERIVDSMFEDTYSTPRSLTLRDKLTYNKENNEVSISVPGYGKEDLELHYENDYLVLRSKDKKLYYSVYLGKDLDPSKCEANCDKGVLKIKLASKKTIEKSKILIK